MMRYDIQEHVSCYGLNHWLLQLKNYPSEAGSAPVVRRKSISWALQKGPLSMCEFISKHERLRLSTTPAVTCLKT